MQSKSVSQEQKAAGVPCRFFDNVFYGGAYGASRQRRPTDRRKVCMTKASFTKKPVCCRCCPGCISSVTKATPSSISARPSACESRVSQYFREGVPHDNKVSQMIAHAYAFDVIVCQSEFEALVLEASQIKAHTPKYNILLKDDKGYSYIRVTARRTGRAFPSPCKRRRTGPSISALTPPALPCGRWQKRPWMPFCCRAAPSASRRRSAKDAPA